jgi:hypothetical protein
MDLVQGTTVPERHAHYLAALVILNVESLVCGVLQ